MRYRGDDSISLDINLRKRFRFVDNGWVSFWQADVVMDGKDYHAAADTPHEALLRLALFWKGRIKSAQLQRDELESSENKPQSE